jgi:hypothetical protein
MTQIEALDSDGIVLRRTGANNFQVLGKRSWRDGVVVLYTTTDPWNPAQDTIGYAFGKQQRGSWQVRASSSGRSAVPLPANRRVDYGAGIGFDQVEPFFIVYGRALAPDVAAVEATFSNGQTVRDTANDKVFALVTPMKPQAVIPCALRVFNPQNQVVEQFPLAAAAPDGPSAQFKQCQALAAAP